MLAWMRRCVDARVLRSASCDRERECQPLSLAHADYTHQRPHAAGFTSAPPRAPPPCCHAAFSPAWHTARACTHTHATSGVVTLTARRHTNARTLQAFHLRAATHAAPVQCRFRHRLAHHPRAMPPYPASRCHAVPAASARIGAAEPASESPRPPAPHTPPSHLTRDAPSAAPPRCIARRRRGRRRAKRRREAAASRRRERHGSARRDKAAWHAGGVPGGDESGMARGRRAWRRGGGTPTACGRWCDVGLSN